MIEQSRRTAEEQRANMHTHSRVGLGACMGARAAMAANGPTPWGSDSSVSSFRSGRSKVPTAAHNNSSSNSSMSHGRRGEETKLMMAGSDRDQGEEDSEDSEHTNSESCVSMCESFSFLSTDKKRSVYGII